MEKHFPSALGWLYALTLGLILPACLGSGGGSAAAAAAPTPLFVERDLAGDWVGTVLPIGTLSDPVSMYLRCDAMGSLYAGADSEGRDWDPGNSYTYAVVKPRGGVFLTVNYGREIMYFDGAFDPAGTSLAGDWTLLYDGSIQNEGSFSFTRALPASFSPAADLQGTWNGFFLDDLGNAKAVVLNLASDGSLSGGSLGPSSLDMASSSPSLVFESDSLGRVAAADLVATDGSSVHVSFLLAAVEGGRLGGSATHSTLGPGRLSLTRP